MLTPTKYKHNLFKQIKTEKNIFHCKNTIMKNTYTTVDFNNASYKVCIDNKGERFVIDNTIDIPDKTFYKDKHGYICCHSDIRYLHHIILDYKFDGTLYVDHINRIKSDNRKANLRLVTQSEQNKNQSKKKRNVVLPDGCGILPDEIPTFIWYIHANNNHGDRWMVEVKNKYSWKTTSSKELSTKCKFEMAKKHLRNLIETQPTLLQGHCINGELSDQAKQLKQEYIEILRRAGVQYVNTYYVEYIEEDRSKNPDKL